MTKHFNSRATALNSSQHRMQSRAQGLTMTNPALNVMPSSHTKSAILALIAAGCFVGNTAQAQQQGGITLALSMNLSLNAQTGSTVALMGVGSQRNAAVTDSCGDPRLFRNVEGNLAPVANTAPNATQCNLPGVKAVNQQPAGTRLVIEFDRDTLPADGQSASVVTIRLLDSEGRLVTGPASYQQVTLEVERGRWSVEDADPYEPGVQVALVNGEAVVKLIAHHTAGDVNVKFSSGNLSVAGVIAYTPDLRPMIAAGIVEGVLNLRKGHSGMFAPAHQNDAFERELVAWSRETGSADKSRTVGAHASLFLKGTIKGEYLLTIGADSDKDTKNKLYRDVKPDQVYPVYGDASIKGWEAQSKSKLYVRVDKNRSYAMFGDIETQEANPGRVLGQYTRNLTGAKWHLEDGAYKLNAFVSQDSQRQTVDEFPGYGISGPYRLAHNNLVAYSERIEIITRDRNQPSIILKVETRQRGIDYDIDPYGGTILFNAPVQGKDANFNPVSIRATYEQETGGKKFLVAGVDSQVKFGERVQLGASVVNSKDPFAPYTLASLNAVLKLTPNTTATIEGARSKQELIGTSSTTDNKGSALRAEVLHQGEALTARAYYTKASDHFADQSKAAANAAGITNTATIATPVLSGPTAALGGSVADSSNNGRTEAGLKLGYKLTDNLGIKGELIHSHAIVNDATRNGIYAGLDYQIAKGLNVELGVRKSHETAAPAFSGTGSNTTAGTDINQTSAVLKLAGKVSDKVTLLAEAEKGKGSGSNIGTNNGTSRYALGAEYQAHEQGVVYLKHERIDSESGLYGLNASQRNNATVLGYRHTYLQDTNMFSEYRLKDAISGQNGAAAYGLRHGWNATPDLKLNATLERLRCIQGNCSSSPDTTAASLAASYIGSDTWKLASKLEYRNAGTTDTRLGTLDAGFKFNRDFTGLSKLTISKANAADGHRNYDNAQIGFAWRETERNRWNALAKLQFIRDNNHAASLGVIGDTKATVLALNANYQATSRFIMSGRLAVKRAHDSFGSTNLNLASLRATYDITDRIDIGAVASRFAGNGSVQSGLGLEAGVLVGQGLWASMGYNWFEVKDKDLIGSDYGSRGVYFRLRYKFDESLFQGKTSSTGEAK